MKYIKKVHVWFLRRKDYIWRCTVKKYFFYKYLNLRADYRKLTNKCCICGKDLAGECYLLKGHLEGRLVGRCCYKNPLKSIKLTGKI